MTQPAINITDVSFDAARRRFNAKITRYGPVPATRQVSVSGDLRWSHQRTIRALLDAAQRA